MRFREFPQAIKIYNNLLEDDHAAPFILEVISDLNKLYSETKLPQFLFAEGYLTSCWLEENRGQELLNTFIKTTENSATEYKCLRELVVKP